MAGNTCNGSKAIILANALNKTAPQNLTLRLFKNNVTPADSDNVNASGYTEATFTGYTSIALTAATWTISTAEPAVASYPQQTFTSSADQTAQLVYGYYITQADSSLLYAEKFSDGPYSISVNGQTIKITPNYSVTDLPSRAAPSPPEQSPLRSTDQQLCRFGDHSAFRR